MMMKRGRKIVQYALTEDAYDRLRKAYRVLERAARLRSVSFRALPDFIIAGAQKSGTSSLYNYLRSHPQVLGVCRFRPDGRTTWGKEIHYFDTKYDEPEWWYRFHFPLEAALAYRNAITGESSPEYLYHPYGARRIADMVPDAKIIICLRNPVDRAVSSYWHYVRKGIETLPIREAFAREEERTREDKKKMKEDASYFGHNHRRFSYLDKGIYADQIARYFDRFDRSQILVIRSENLFRDTQTVFDKVVAFLGLPAHRLNDDRVYNSGSYEEIDDGLREELRTYYQPHNQRLYDLLELESPWW